MYSLPRRYGIIALAIFIPLLSNCGEEGKTLAFDTQGRSLPNVAITASSSSVSAFQLFASQYYQVGSNPGVSASTKEDGFVYVGQDGGFLYGSFGIYDERDIRQRQGYGIQWKTDPNNLPLDSSSNVYIIIKPPNNQNQNISASTKLVLSFGNSRNANIENFSSPSHKVFILQLNGGQPLAGSRWQNECLYQVSLDADKQAAIDPIAEGTNRFGIHAYEFNLSDFNCQLGNLDDLKNQLAELAIKVIGGDNPDADNTTIETFFLPIVGFVGFSGDRPESDSSYQTNTPYKLFASHYRVNTAELTTSQTYQSFEGGDVNFLQQGNFIKNLGFNAAQISQRQAVGFQFESAAGVSDQDFAGLSVKAPFNASMDISSSTIMVIQLGNGRATDGPFSDTTSHLTFSLELDNDTNHCSYDLRLENSSRPSLELKRGTNPYGLHTYEINLNDFSCQNGSLNALKQALNRVTIKIIGAKDQAASEIATNSLIQVGWIAFKK